MPDRDISRGDPGDVRFQFEIIKGLSESIRQMATNMADMQKTQVNMLERLATLEANRIGDVVTKMESSISAVAARVDNLERDKDHRDGAVGVFDWVRVWGPVLFSFAAAVWLFGRSLGIVPAPPTAHDPPAIERRSDGK